MAVFAVGRGHFAGLADLGVVAVRVSELRIGMASGARDFLRRRLVNQALHILVAVHAGKHRAVDRMLQLACIHIQADLLSIHFRAHGGVGVAGKAIFVLGLMFSAGRTGPNEQG